MTRLFLIIWMALSLTVASGPAFAMPAPDCGMASSGMADHNKMGCCTPDCAVACPAVAVVLPSGSDLSRVDQLAAPSSMPPVSVHPSIHPAADDPPPRTVIS